MSDLFWNTFQQSIVIVDIDSSHRLLDLHCTFQQCPRPLFSIFVVTQLVMEGVGWGAGAAAA